MAHMTYRMASLVTGFAVAMWVIAPQLTQAHTVVFPNMPTVITVPLPPPVQPETIETRQPMGDSSERSRPVL
jgi:hypothetical protein